MDSPKCAVYDTNTVQIEHEHIVEGGKETAGFAMLGETAKLKSGIWEHSVGSSIDVEVDEVFVIFSGRGRIFVDDEVLELAPGVVGTLYEGAKTRWEVDELIRKVYIFPNTSR